MVGGRGLILKDGSHADRASQRAVISLDDAPSGITGGDLDKDDPLVKAAHEWVMGEFDAGRQNSIEWEEMWGKIGNHKSE